ncbi:MAG: DUF6242 domain-containing protein [Bacteroidaceae bacterium]|nr:DUF6242 domain-containing protein [Bacteroidaceae bacterium]
MRTKLLMAIACLLGVCIGFGACMKGNDEDIEVNVSTYVTAFGLDTIYGEYYDFTIDQVNHRIFNADSLPVGSEERLKAIAIKTFAASGVITSGLLDSLFVIDQVADLTPAINKPGISFKIVANDGSRWQEYTLQVNVHLEDPDEAKWKNLSGMPLEFLEANDVTDLQLLKRGHELMVMLEGNIMTKADVSGLDYVWDIFKMEGLPDDAMLHSARCFQGTLCMTTESGDVYTSEDGEYWEKNEVLSGNVTSLLAEFTDKLTSILDVEGESVYGFTFALDEPWTIGEPVQPGFPMGKVSTDTYISSTGVERAILVGDIDDESDRTTPWMTIDGDDWGEMSTNTEYYCPPLSNPTVMFYDDFFYMVGSGLDEMYESIGGLVWGESEGSFQLPEEVMDHDYFAMIPDENDFIWLLVIGNEGEPNQLWRGRVNALSK